MAELVLLLVAIAFIVVAYLAFQLLVWRRPVEGQVVIQTVPAEDPASGCATTLGALVLFILVGLIAWLAMPDLLGIANSIASR
jgi:hypothetical protein